VPERTTVILTRAPEDNAELAAELRAKGIAVIELSCVRVEHLTDPAPLAHAICSLGSDDRLVFTSRAGVDAARRCVASVDVRAPVAVVGPATAARCADWGLAAWMPSRALGSCLGRELGLGSGSVLLVRGDHADPSLARELVGRGARVREIVAYRVIASALGDVEAARRAALAGAAICVASPSAVDALVQALGQKALACARVFAIGPTTACAVVAAIALEPTVLRDLSADQIARELEVADAAYR
jgi:uroporphyrinogen-III synthase